MNIIYRQRRGHAKKVLCVEKEIVYDSLTDASRETEIDCGSISRVCKGERQTAGGYHWKYVQS